MCVISVCRIKYILFLSVSSSREKYSYRSFKKMYIVINSVIIFTCIICESEDLSLGTKVKLTLCDNKIRDKHEKKADVRRDAR